MNLPEVEINGDGASIFNKAVRADLLTIGAASDGTALNDLAEAIYLTINGNDTTFNNVTATQLTLAESKGATTNGSLQIGGAILSNNSVLSIAGEGGTNSGTINGGADDGDGTVKFMALVEDNVGAIGGNKTLGTVEINTDGSKFNALVAANAVDIKGNTTFSGALTANETLILADNKTISTGGDGKVFTLNGVATMGHGSKLTVGAGGIAGGGKIIGASAYNGNVIFSSVVNAGEVGSVGGSGGPYLKSIEINGAGASTFNTDMVATSIVIGAASDGSFFESTLAAYTTINGDNTTFATLRAYGGGPIGIADGKQVTVNERLSSYNISLGNGSTLIVACEGGSTSGGTGNIDGYADGYGTVTFSEIVNADEVGKLGYEHTLGTVNIEGADSVFTKSIAATAVNVKANTTFGAAVTTDQLVLDAATVTLASDLITVGEVVAENNSTINLAGHNLTATSLVLDSAHSMNLNFGTKNIGSLTLTNPVVADDKLAATSTITADLSGVTLPSVGTRVNLVTLNAADDYQAELMYSYLQEQITLKGPSNTLVAFSPIRLQQYGSILTAYVTTSAPSYEDLVNTQYGQINNEFVGDVWDSFLRAYSNDSLGTIEKQYFANATQLTPEENEALFIKLSMFPTISDVASSDINNHAAVIFNRNSMIAAGDENSKRGAWANIFGSHKTQKRNKSNSGFKANNAGITIGSDIAMSEHHTIGLAGSFVNNNATLKDSLSGSKVKAKSYILSLYNIYDINNWVMQGSFSIANTKSTVITADIAKFNSIFYGARGSVGYQKHFGKNTITPMIGLEYSHYGKSKATEANTQRIIKINALDKFSAILGASIARKVGNFTPEIHAFVNYDLTHKAQKTNIRLGSDATMNLATPNAKPSRLTYDFGTSIGAKSDRFEYSVGYDASLTEKYVSHQGSIKLRVNF